MPSQILCSSRSLLARLAPPMVVVLAMVCVSRNAVSQDVPLISGGVGFFSNTNGGNTTYLPILEPLITAPVGQHLLVESRAALLESFNPSTNGYDHTHFAGFTYLQGDFIATPHLTIVAGSFLVPFGTYNERLSPIWIGNFQSGPTLANLATFGGTGVGGEIRGSAFSNSKFSVSYAGYFSARSDNEQFNSERSAGGQSGIFLKDSRLELGFSYNRLLQGTHENFFGTHVWWDPKDTAVRLRSEFASGEHAHGYWVEADYRLQRFGGPESVVGRIEPVFRMQQSFQRDAHPVDGLPGVDTQRADFGLDYYLPHNTRILTSYSRQFSAVGNSNIWQTGIVYRFLFPTWKGSWK